MSKILELADAYARETHPALITEARAALQAEVERTERRVFDMRVIFDAACTERDALREEVQDLRSSLADAVQLLDEARKDAARYRWLRENYKSWSWQPTQYNKEVVSGFAAFNTGYSGFSFENAIDAAMEATK